MMHLVGRNRITNVKTSSPLGQTKGGAVSPTCIMHMRVDAAFVMQSRPESMTYLYSCSQGVHCFTWAQEIVQSPSSQGTRLLGPQTGVWDGLHRPVSHESPVSQCLYST